MKLTHPLLTCSYNFLLTLNTRQHGLSNQQTSDIIEEDGGQMMTLVPLDGGTWSVNCSKQGNG